MSEKNKPLMILPIKLYKDIVIVSVGFQLSGLTDDEGDLISYEIASDDCFAFTHLAFELLKGETTEADVYEVVVMLVRARAESFVYAEEIKKLLLSIDPLMEAIKTTLVSLLGKIFKDEDLKKWQIAAILRTDQVAFVKKLGD